MRIKYNCNCKNVLVYSGNKLFFFWLSFDGPLKKSLQLAYSIRNNFNQKNRLIIYILIAKDSILQDRKLPATMSLQFL